MSADRRATLTERLSPAGAWPVRSRTPCHLDDGRRSQAVTLRSVYDRRRTPIDEEHYGPRMCLLPDDVLIKILEYTSPATVISSKRLNHRFQKLIERHRLGRPIVDEFSVEMRQIPKRTAPLGRLQLKPSCGHRRRLVVTLRRKSKFHRIINEDLQGPSSCNQMISDVMDKVKLGEVIAFDGIAVDRAFCETLLNKRYNLSEVKNVTFTLSHLQLNEEQMLSLLSKTSVESLTFDFCHFENDVLSDKVIMELDELKCLRVQPRQSGRFCNFTDSTLDYWKAKGAPSQLALYNCTTACTLKGILDLIQVETLGKRSVDWDFGRVSANAQSSEHLLRLTMMSGAKVTVTDDYRSRRVVIQHSASKVAFNLVYDLPFTS